MNFNWEEQCKDVKDGIVQLKKNQMPICPDCGALLRPRVLMFGDGGYDRRPDEH